MEIKQDKGENPIIIRRTTGITISIATIGVILGLVYGLASTLTTYQGIIANNQKINEEQAVRIEKLETENIDAKVKLSEIQVQLRSIDATLTEIKQRL